MEYHMCYLLEVLGSFIISHSLTPAQGTSSPFSGKADTDFEPLGNATEHHRTLLLPQSSRNLPFSLQSSPAPQINGSTVQPLVPAPTLESPSLDQSLLKAETGKVQSPGLIQEEPAVPGAGCGPAQGGAGSGPGEPGAERGANAEARGARSRRSSSPSAPTPGAGRVLRQVRGRPTWARRCRRGSRLCCRGRGRGGRADCPRGRGGPCAAVPSSRPPGLEARPPAPPPPNFPPAPLPPRAPPPAPHRSRRARSCGDVDAPSRGSRAQVAGLGGSRGLPVRPELATMSRGDKT
ncbi:proline-rich proteoglycan 2-like [Camelus dromedarius]|uniref:proline-rich proteoglycan 2-like n=1 Tax=Camelus dromedarius TaxID=9838 RepID=UPI0031196F22